MIEIAPIKTRLEIFLRDRGPAWTADPPHVRARQIHGLGIDLSCAWFLAHAADDVAALLHEVEEMRAALVNAVYVGSRHLQ